MQKSIIGYNEAAKRGKDAAMKYCQQWKMDITKESAALAVDLSSKKISVAAYNLKRDALNRSTKDLNECIQAINKQFG
jgi:hypothetical protein